MPPATPPPIAPAVRTVSTIFPSALDPAEVVFIFVTFMTLGWLGMLGRRDAVGDPVGEGVCLAGDAVRVCPLFCIGLSTSNSLTSVE
jgi:hypothetical protein